MESTINVNHESPEYLRMSLAAAMTLGFKRGLFHRCARLYCINLLLNYNSGCAARCAYCGLSHKREGEYSEKSFIRVTWPTDALDEIIDELGRDRVEAARRLQEAGTPRPLQRQMLKGIPWFKVEADPCPLPVPSCETLRSATS